MFATTAHALPFIFIHDYEGTISFLSIESLIRLYIYIYRYVHTTVLSYILMKERKNVHAPKWVWIGFGRLFRRPVSLLLSSSRSIGPPALKGYFCSGTFKKINARNQI